MKAFVAINVSEAGKEEEAVKELEAIPGVKVYRLYGIYDLLVEVDSESSEKLRNVIAKKIRGVKSIRSTLTLEVVK